MEVKIKYAEVHDYISGKFGKDVNLSRVDDRTVCVSVSQKIFIKTVQVGLNIKVCGVNGDVVELEYGGGFGMDLIVAGVLSFVKGKLPEYGAAFEETDNHKIKITLSAIRQMREVMKSVSLEGVLFTPNSIEATLGLII